ncbi:hypothetical protein C8J57DRAFT_183448 [Mycena rebaudengoi]|nr:hypothetical protein C8J57DRAFT_183448 [Mycena rebaudengoi]
MHHNHSSESVIVTTMSLDGVQNELAEPEASNRARLSQEPEERQPSAETDLVSSLHPILTLAPELTAEIFMYCVEYDSAPVSNEAPLSVSHVCRLWRDISLSCPSLWTSLTYLGPPFDGTPLSGQKSAEVISTWFGRSSFLLCRSGRDRICRYEQGPPQSSISPSFVTTWH